MTQLLLSLRKKKRSRPPKQMNPMTATDDRQTNESQFVKGINHRLRDRVSAGLDTPAQLDSNV